MKLNDFEQYVDEVIIERGRRYHREKRVEFLDKQQEGLCIATVTGSDNYSVTVELDEQETIVEANCDCPYTGGPYCKHMVAVFLALRKEDTHRVINKSSSAEEKVKKKLPVKKNLREQLKSDLARHSKEKLIHLILDIAEDNVLIANQIRAEFSSGSDEKEKWIRVMQSYIEQAEDQDGFINYHNCQIAVEGAYKVVERAQRAFDEEEYEFAVDLALCVMGEMVDMLQFADDSAGDVSMVIDEVKQLLTVITDEVPAGRMAEACFLKILREAGQGRYNGWSDWRMDLFYHCAALAGNHGQREQLEKCLQKISLESEKQGMERTSFSRQYESEAIALLQYELIGKFDGKKAAADFLRNHCHFSRFRELAIQDAMVDKDYARAEELAVEGEECDKELPGLIRKWKESRFETYRLEKNLDKMRKVGRELALLGEFNYYQKLKRLYDSVDWAQIYPEILLELEKQPGYTHDTYVSAIVEEKEWEKLLKYVQRNPYRILDFYRQLLKEYREQVYEIFTGLILREVAHSNKRSNYQSICSHLRLLIKIGGNHIAADLVKKLMFEYKRRPAFCEELQKVKIN